MVFEEVVVAFDNIGQVRLDMRLERYSDDLGRLRGRGSSASNRVIGDAATEHTPSRQGLNARSFPHWRQQETIES